MTVDDTVTDPSLKMTLEISKQTCDHAIALLDLALFRFPAPDLETAEATYHIPSSITRASPRRTPEARQEIDRLHLALQNLYYEERHLQGEIVACESYDHKYQQLPLIPVDQFLADHPEHAGADEVALTIARIDHEHAERLALEEQRQALLKKKQGLIADNKKRKEDLANLDKDLEKFIDAAKPIQKTFER
ncbi:putative THOC5 family protein [Lachnellula hyalina]|uniref:Putative THOC5 family protein n=1 Tax=Lachnellula hyalina TaxID=1316788 RepID=A0A8H8RAB1_9HELO|nr:putative THOC5 family protein [Lachnellula hyalina]TVY30467.1 putative THOC5 family protein [Lachnellula hyalina]